MNSKQSLRNGLIVVVILIATSMVAAIWSGLSGAIGSTGGGGGGISAPSVQMTTVTLPALPLIGEIGEVNSLVALGALVGLVGGGVVVVGGGLAFLYTLLERLAVSNAASESFKEAEAALAKRQKETIKALNEDRETTGPNEYMPRWSVISTGMIFVLFMAVLAAVILAAVGGATNLQGEDILSSPIVGAALVVTLALFAWRVRPQNLRNAYERDDDKVPWDFIAVLLTGSSTPSARASSRSSRARSGISGLRRSSSPGWK